MLWKVFSCSCVAVFTTALWGGINHGDFTNMDWAGANVKFGHLADTKNANAVKLLPVSILLGVMGGLLGAFFISMNSKVNKKRKMYLTKSWYKPLETCFFSFMTATCFFLLPWFLSDCKMVAAPTERENEGSMVSEETYRQAWCAEGYYNPLATLFWSSEGEIITNIIGGHIKVTQWGYVLFFLVWYFFFTTSFGTNVPSGLFLPGMILGCCLGELTTYGLDTIGYFSEGEMDVAMKNLVVLANASMLAGYTRMTYSLAVIIMETGQVINLFVPVFFTIMVANLTGAQFTRGAYDRSIRTKQFPILQDWIPAPCKDVIAQQLMNRNLVSFRAVETLYNIKKGCLEGHHAFPVLNEKGNIIGMIPRNFVVVLLRYRAFYVNELEMDDGTSEAQSRAPHVRQALKEEQEALR